MTARRSPESPEFGPGGYLPERAAKRARKIVLRAPLGLQWIVGAVVVGVVLLVAGLVFLRSAGGPPGAPFERVGPLASLARPTDVHDGVLLVTGLGRVRAFAGAADVAYCAEADQLESPDGRVWSLTGRGYDGGPSLDEHPVIVHDGVVYLDATRTVPGPAPSGQPASPVCLP